MNRKGFTLIELLATILILGIVGGIATYGVINTINTSKLKSEKMFVDKLSNLIDDYLDLYSKELTPTNETVKFGKCKVDECSEEDYYFDDDVVENSKAYQVTATKMTSIHISNLVDKKMITYEELKNPKNKQQCFGTIFGDTYNPEIVIYKDEEFVYHYYFDLSDNRTNCDITYENALIDNMPKNLIENLKNQGVTLPKILIDTLS